MRKLVDLQLAVCFRRCRLRMHAGYQSTIGWPRRCFDLMCKGGRAAAACATWMFTYVLHRYIVTSRVHLQATDGSRTFTIAYRAGSDRCPYLSCLTPTTADGYSSAQRTSDRRPVTNRSPLRVNHTPVTIASTASCSCAPSLVTPRTMSATIPQVGRRRRCRRRNTAGRSPTQTISSAIEIPSRL